MYELLIYGCMLLKTASFDPGNYPSCELYVRETYPSHLDCTYYQNETYKLISENKLVLSEKNISQVHIFCKPKKDSPL